MGRTILLTYATENFEFQRQALCESALSVGFDEVLRVAPDHIRDTDFALQNADILNEKRGAGFWLWKPYIIADALKSLQPDDVLLYCDAGRTRYYRFTNMPSALISKVREISAGFLVGAATPQHGPLKRWTKRDCLLIMDADSAGMLERPVIQTTWSVWRNTAPAILFLQKWLAYATDRRCLTDDENVLGKANYPEYVDHRHDQSIATILAYRNNAPYLDFTNLGVFKWLSLRPQSSLAHNFLKRPQDASDLLAGRNVMALLIAAFLEMKLSK